MQILDCITTTYTDQYGGGTRYPDLNGPAVLDWIERSSRLVLFLDCDAATAQSLADANAAYKVRVATAADVDAHVWQATRTKRDNLLADAIGIRDRHRDERELVAAAMRPETTLTEAEFLELLGYIDALRHIPNGYAYPAAVAWPVVPACAA